MNHGTIKKTALAMAIGACAIFALPSLASAAESDKLFDPAELFTDRDYEQEADLTEATRLTLSNGKDLVIDEEGIYLISGTAENASVIVDADDQAKVQLVLDGAAIENDSTPCVYVREADKVFLTTAGDSSLSVTGTFEADGDVNTDGAVFSRCDLTLNGTGTLTVSSTDNGVVCKDDLKVTGGSYIIEAGSKAVEANDSIRIDGGSLTLTAGTDGLHAENDDDDSLGYIYIGSGSLTIYAGDDAVHAQSAAQFDGGSTEIYAGEGIESTYIQINDGEISIQASDDGVNAGWKSSAYPTAIEINGGSLTVVMGSGDTDGIDSNGDLYINGGTVDVTGGSTFDCDGVSQYNGGTIIVNGQQVSYIPNQMGMGGGRGKHW